jgi:hypothetical protein
MDLFRLKFTDKKCHKKFVQLFWLFVPSSPNFVRVVRINFYLQFLDEILSVPTTYVHTHLV